MFTAIEKPDYDLEKTLNCGQVFRYRKEAENTYRVISRDHSCKVKKEGDYLLLTDTSRSVETLGDFWPHYLGVDWDMTEFKEKMESDPFLREIYRFGEGLYLLNQDPWECLISFIISQQKRIPQIKSCIERFCKGMGIWSADGQFNSFPTPYDIDLDCFDNDPYGFGYRKDYVMSATMTVINHHIDFNQLKAGASSCEDAIKKLCTIYGVGVKIANCVALFSLGHKDAFPIDVHMKKIFEHPALQDLDVDAWGNCKGLLQQYLFYYALHHNY